MVMLDYSVGEDAAKLSKWHCVPFFFLSWKSMNGVLVRAFPRMLFWVVLMYYHSSTGQNQSEEKGLVTPSFSLSCCNVTSEKIDQEMYFWSRLSPPTSTSLTFKLVLLWLFFALSDCQISLHRLVWFLTFTLISRLLYSPSLQTKATRGRGFFLLVFIAPVLTEEESYFPFTMRRPFLSLWCSMEFSECMAQVSQTVTWRPTPPPFSSPLL